MENSLLSILRQRLQPPDDQIENNDKNNLFYRLKGGRFKSFVFRPHETSSDIDGSLTCIGREEESLSNIIYSYNKGKARDFIISVNDKIGKNHNFKKEVCDGPNFLSYMLHSSEYIDRILYNYLLKFYILQKEKIALNDVKMADMSDRPWLNFSYSV